MNRSLKQLAALALAPRRLAALACGLCLPVVALAEEHAEHAAEHGEHHGWDQQALIASFVNFAILIGLFVYLFRNSLKSFLKARRAEVQNALEEAARLKAEAEAKHREYSERLAKLDQELAQIKNDLIEAGKQERDRIIADAEHKAARLRREAEFIIEQHAKQLRVDLSREAANAAVAAAEQLLLRATTTYDQQRLANEYLASLNANRPSSQPPKKNLNSLHSETPRP
ncbi:MAG: ATP synthase F0 subunit B [Polyangiales bacterium]